MKMRHFIYADTKEIDSMYSQIFDDITEINTTVSKENKAEIETEIKIPNILHGFLPGNFSGDYERDYNRVVSTQSHISIEKKVMSLLEKVSFCENDAICQCDDKLLVAGYVEVMKYNHFLEKANELLQAEELVDFKSFYEKFCEDICFSSLWKELTKKIIPSIDHKIPIDWQDLYEVRRSSESQKIEKLIILNADYPVIINFSHNKLLLSASQMSLWGKLCHAENLYLLGFMRRDGVSCYSIKPVVMWEIFESQKTGKGFIAEIKTFRNRWNN